MTQPEIKKAIEIIKQMLNYRNVNTDDCSLDMQQSFLKTFDFDVRDGVKIVRVCFNLAKTKPLVSCFLPKDTRDLSPILYRIIVHTDKLSAKEIADFNGQNKDYQVFQLADLQFNISQHMLVPKHVLIQDPADISVIMLNHSVKSKTQFPLILRSDPMARFLFAKPGNLIKVSRVSQTACHHDVFRCVV